MRPQLLFKHVRETPNVGDRSCCPYDYLPFEGASVRDLYDGSAAKTDVVIYGGGQILGSLRRYASQSERKAPFRLGWGIGTSQSSLFTPSKWRDRRYLHMIGSRDYGDERYHFAPCASCLSPLFDQTYVESHDAVFYGHARKTPSEKITVPDHMPALWNEAETLEEVIAFLGSARTVISNSYHGVYWSLLLGKRVLCLPFSRKFLSYRLPPGYTDPQSWTGEVTEARSQPESLALCREATERFRRRVNEEIDARFGGK